MVKKVGFSASVCICDILDGVVDIDDVVSITTSTRTHTREEWLDVIKEYHRLGYFNSKLEKATSVGEQLWDLGLIHQPRNVGAYRAAHIWPWMDLVHTNADREKIPALKAAWESAQLIEALVSGNNTGAIFNE